MKIEFLKLVSNLISVPPLALESQSQVLALESQGQLEKVAKVLLGESLWGELWSELVPMWATRYQQ